MVKRIVSLVIALSSILSHVNAQDTIPQVVGLIQCDEMPYFKGDIDNFIKHQLVYPKTALKDKIGGSVIVSFIVDTCGNTIKHFILKGIRNDIDSEALRIAKLIKFDKPAFLNKKPVSIRYNLVIKFQVPNNSKRSLKKNPVPGH